MSEPTSAKTMSELITEVARFIGMPWYGAAGDEVAKVPVNKHDLAECRRIVNNGIRMFIANGPPNGWKWQHRQMYVRMVASEEGTATSGSSTTLTDTALITTVADNDIYIDCILEITAGTGRGETAIVTDYAGDTGVFTFTALSGGSTPSTDSEYRVGHRYLLPQDFGGEVDGPIKYIEDTNHTTTMGWTHEADIRNDVQIVPENSYPYKAATRAYGIRRWELLVYPYPVAADVLIFPYTKYFDKLFIESGLATSATAQTIVDTTRKEADKYFDDWILTVISGPGELETATVIDYDKTTTTFTFSALSGASTPTTASYYTVEPALNQQPAGFMFDETILAACLARAEMEINDVVAGWVQNYNQIALPQAHLIDARLSPRKVSPPFSRYGIRGKRERTWTAATYNTSAPT